MATTTQDEGFHEIQLNGKQLVFLFMAVTVVSVVIFLSGVLVGRGVRAERGLPLAGDEVSAPVESATVPAPSPSPGTSDKPTTAGESLSYAGRLSAADPAPEPLKAAEPPPTVQESIPPTPAADSAAPPAPPPAAAPAEPAGSGYSIQVAALAKLQEAEVVAQRLTGKGYAAYVVAPSTGAPAVYRVRVGKFKDRREAQAVADRLQKEEQFKPWILR